MWYGTGGKRWTMSDEIGVHCRTELVVGEEEEAEETESRRKRSNTKWNNRFYVCWFVYLSVYLFIYLSVCLLYVCLFVCLKFVNFLGWLFGRGFGHFNGLDSLVHVMLLLRCVVVAGRRPVLRCGNGAVDVVARDDVDAYVRRRTQRIRPYLLLISHLIQLVFFQVSATDSVIL